MELILTPAMTTSPRQSWNLRFSPEHQDLIDRAVWASV
jgi:uncharacterized protein (DUF1778 family)